MRFRLISLHSIGYRYAAAVLLAMAAQLLRISLPLPPGLLLITYVPFTVASALLGGFGPGLVTTVVCELEIVCFALQPVGLLALRDPANKDRIGAFLLTGLITSILAQRLQRDKERLSESHRRTRAILESISDGFTALDRNWRYTYVNAAAAKMLGRKPEEMLGNSLWELWPHASYAPFGPVLRRSLEENIPLQVDGFYPESLNAWFEVRCYPSPDGLSLFFTDVTGRKQAEQKCLLLSSVVESSDDAIVSKNLGGMILSWNTGAERIYGYKAEEVLGHHISILSPPDRQDEFTFLIDDLRRGLRIDHYETERIRKDGSRIFMSLTMSAIKDSEQRIVGASVIGRDITARKTAEQALVVSEERYRSLSEHLEKRVIERTAELEAANHELEAFAYSVSHDLRAPLRAVDGFSRILLEEYAPQLPEEARHYLESARNNAVQMGNLIDGLLAFSRLGRQPIRKQTVALAELVRQVLDDLRLEQAGRRVEITVGHLPDCQGDPLLLKQVLVNLISNALKYTRNRELANVEVGCSESSVYYVRDNGVGFDMRYASKLFGVFQRLHRAEDYEGAGVGLAIVQRIIQRLGGRVWADASVNQGATFYFTLPDSSKHHQSNSLEPVEQKAERAGS